MNVIQEMNYVLYPSLFVLFHRLFDIGTKELKQYLRNEGEEKCIYVKEELIQEKRFTKKKRNKSKKRTDKTESEGRKENVDPILDLTSLPFFQSFPCFKSLTLFPSHASCERSVLNRKTSLEWTFQPSFHVSRTRKGWNAFSLVLEYVYHETFHLLLVHL